MKSDIVQETSARFVALLAFALASGCSESSEGGSAAGGGASGAPTGGTAGAAGSTSGAAGGGSGGAATGGTAGMPSDGICRPVLVQPTANPNAVELLRVTQSGLFGLRSPQVFGDMVLYADPDGLGRIPKAGGMPERLFMDEQMPGFYLANDLAYFLRENVLYSVSATAPSTTPATVIPSVEYMNTTDSVIGVDATNLYVSVRATNEIRAIALATGMVTPLVRGIESQGWLLTNGFVYFVGPNDTIQRVAVTGGAAETLYRGDHIVHSIGVDGADLYYGGSGSLYRVGTPETTLLSWDVEFLVAPTPVGNRIVFGGWNGDVGWVMKDASSCQGIAEARSGLSWDTDDANVFLVMDNVLYRIAL